MRVINVLTNIFRKCLGRLKHSTVGAAHTPMQSHTHVQILKVF